VGSNVCCGWLLVQLAPDGVHCLPPYHLPVVITWLWCLLQHTATAYSSDGSVCWLACVCWLRFS